MVSAYSLDVTRRHTRAGSAGPSIRSTGERGFTLVELMIVVAIVGVLASLAVVGYRKLILSAHTSEATHMVQSIRVAQETYHAETQTFVSTSADGLHGLFPTLNDPPSNTKTNWNTATGGCPAGGGVPSCFALLPIHADGPVSYGYATTWGAALTSPPTMALPNGTTLTATTGPSQTDWYWISASGNMNNQASPANWSYVVANSFTNNLYVQDQ